MHIPRIAIIGMGGYAARHHRTVLQLEEEGQCALCATCDPRPEAFAEAAAGWRLAERGVRVYGDYREMLARHAGEIDVVIIPTPIPLHAEMHRAAVEAGMAVYLEKPPTLDPVELEAMIACDAKARVPTLVGFNFIAEPVRQALRRRLEAGEFGEVEAVGFLGLWGRALDYFTRAEWAGRLAGRDGRLILDSCMGNALSHHVHNALHWAGRSGERWAMPTRVWCELRRAHAIEGPDTVFLAAETDTGTTVRLAMSHACSGADVHRETICCGKAEIEYVTGRQAAVKWKDGRSELLPLGGFDAQRENLLALIACLKGGRAKPPTTLADSRPFVRLHALAYVSAARIHDWPEEAVLREADGVRPGWLQAKGVEEEAAEFVATGRWRGPAPRAATPAELGKLEAVARAMSRDRAAVPQP